MFKMMMMMMMMSSRYIYNDQKQSLYSAGR